ncbi:amidohydrolase/deacetylase family metallohydrolase [Cyclobacterium jeungdonense]|uniref:Amidohydrolase/deacetylase family metallohydrolase n=1 Tax=Cyclobacterium jeungdonense TaxID=708087 RepID=A0ABT8C5P8_9BACT|nr:amidohydrolase/deacetylase family metallohydrolase [Cyclobacterium jeungdonense]MDN3687800.1 amidohydrolase/deacetylase family metallohydrolase [Cyclobacterium jeungdonense]
MKKTCLSLALLCWSLLSVHAQQYDILIKNGHVIDPKNQLDEVMDIAIKDQKIAFLAPNMNPSDAVRIIDAQGMIVTPGLIDIHGHHFYGTVPHRYLSNSFTALPPDGFTFRAGVTTVADAGGAGWRNFRQFKEQVIDRSRTRVLAFINIVGDGMSGVVPREQDQGDMDAKMTAMVARQFPEIIGVKIAHYRGHEWEPYRKAAEAGSAANIPVMVDLGGADPALPLATLFLEILRPGDILTHMYGRNYSGHGPKEAVIDESEIVREHWWIAQKKGLIFDVGHGGGSFYYDVAVPATQQGFWPNTISTDLHTGSMNGGMKDMLNVVSKMMNLGMSLQEAIEAATWKPAQVIQREDLGHLSVGAEADLAIFSLRQGEFGFLDSAGESNTGTQKLETELTLRAGSVVWDLNGLGSRPWND